MDSHARALEEERKREEAAMDATNAIFTAVDAMATLRADAERYVVSHLLGEGEGEVASFSPV